MADHRQHPRNSTDDVFDDEYAVDDHYDGIADGFAPGRVQPGNDRWSIHSEDPSIHSALPHMSDAPRFSTGSGRNSMHKPRHDQNPFSSNEDDDDDNIDERSALHRSSSIQSTSTAQYAPGIAHRLSTASSARVFARTASPIPGTTGPSHPYSMYPQDTNVARHPSTSTTASTVRAAQTTAASNQGPTHPYSMYPQNVSEHDIADSTAATNHAQTVIPVGFPGRTQAFARTRGPGDEEQDIIGVDGHSEQLPPYSEYPEDGVPKPIVLPGAVQTATPPSGPQVLIPLMQQQHQPESMSDQAAAHGFAEMQQLNSTDSYGASSEAKSWKEKSWKEKRKTRFCGIPFWWILLSLCVLAFIAIVLGAAIGGIFAGARKEAVKAVTKHNGTNTTTLLDASPIPTSSIGAPPPTGVYALDFGAPRATQSACIANQNYSAAWTCNIYGIPQMAINIGLPPDGSDNEGASLYGFSNATGINYGTQPPNTHFAPFISVEDDDEPYRGPAFYFQTFYDKFVVVPEASLPASGASNPQKRSLNNPDWFTQHQVAAGDKPWFCWFNGTFLEGFIYANNYTDPSQSSASSSALSSTSSYPNSKHAKTSSSPLTTSTIIEVSGPSTTATLTSAYQTATYTHSASSAYTHGSNKRRAKREWQLEKRSWSFAELSSFGYVVKIEERRVPDSVQPYCQQFQILDNGMAGPLVDPGTGQQITVYLQETDPDYSAYQQETYGGAAPTGSSKVKRDPINGACHCEWWSGSSPNS